MNNREIDIFDIGHYRNEDGPGIRTIVFFKGCPLRCEWCSNPFGLTAKTQPAFNQSKCIRCGACIKACKKGCNQFKDDGIELDFNRCDACGDCIAICPTKARRMIGERISIEKLFEMVVKDASFYRRTKGGITLSGGEVLQQYEAAAELLRKCRGCLFLSTAIETSAYGPWEHLEMLANYCDLVFVDLKLFDKEKHIRYTGVSNELILENIRKLCELSAEKGTPKIIIRRPIISGINDDDETAIAIAKFINDLPGHPEVNLLPYHNLGETKYSMIGQEYKLENQEMMDGKSPILTRIRDLTSQYAPENRISIGGGEIQA
jgi:pyruvate formate lyase activating enzyme